MKLRSTSLATCSTSLCERFGYAWSSLKGSLFNGGGLGDLEDSVPTSSFGDVAGLVTAELDSDADVVLSPAGDEPCGEASEVVSASLRRDFLDLTTFHSS